MNILCVRVKFLFLIRRGQRVFPLSPVAEHGYMTYAPPVSLTLTTFPLNRVVREGGVSEKAILLQWGTVAERPQLSGGCDRGSSSECPTSKVNGTVKFLKHSGAMIWDVYSSSLVLVPSKILTYLHSFKF